MSNKTAVQTFLVRAAYHLHTDDVAAFKVIAVRVAQGAKERAGCLFFDAVQNVSDPALFHLVEGWTSREALAAHSASEEFKALLQEALTLRILDRSASLYLVSGVENLPMPS